MFTGAILPLEIAPLHLLSSAILVLRGNSFLHPGNLTGRFRPLSALAGYTVVDVCPEALENRPRLLRPAHRRHLPLPRHGTRARTQPRISVRIRSSELRDFLRARLGVRSRL